MNTNDPQRPAQVGSSPPPSTSKQAAQMGFSEKGNQHGNQNDRDQGSAPCTNDTNTDSPAGSHSLDRIVRGFFRWVSGEIKITRRDWLNYSLAIGGWRLMPWWCQRNRCRFKMWNDLDGNWTVKVGVFEHTDKDRGWATTIAAIQYFHSANAQDHV
jgi:hypothetical protein